MITNQKNNPFSNDGPAVYIKDMDVVFNSIKKVPTCNSRGHNACEYINMPFAFDIETTSSYNQFDEKIAFMYHWQFGINGSVIFGRTWEEFKTLINKLVQFFGLNEKRRIAIFVHNLSFEFQFIKGLFKWVNTFSLDDRKIVRAIADCGVEFRCSYVLSGYSLETVGEKLVKYPVKKLVGQLDYEKIRHSNTPITEQELAYCENDVRVIMSYIREKMEEDGGVCRILMTQTSYVRDYVRKHTIYNQDDHVSRKYKKLISHLTLETEEFKMSKEAAAGGFTHANAKYVDKTIENVDSIDLTSSYLGQMLSFTYPMTKGKRIDIKDKKEFAKYIKFPYLSIFKIKFTGLKIRKRMPDKILSLSRCYADEAHTKKYPNAYAIVDNGRIVEAYEDVYTTITSVDFESLTAFYTWEDFEVTTMYVYMGAYLPKPFIECILHFYKLKTELKGVKGREVEYQWSKSMALSMFGMCITDICREKITFDGDDWGREKLNDNIINANIETYNKSRTRFLSYPWGVFALAYARRAVFSGIIEFGDDYIYSDTDCVKGTNIENHINYIEKYNENIANKIAKTLKDLGLNPADACPLDINGNPHQLGAWDWETKGNRYKKFKSIGAKRYLTLSEDGHYNLTVAGFSKFSGQYEDGYIPISTIDVLVKKYGDDKIFDEFKVGMNIEANEICRNLITYIDEPCEGSIVDYLGNKGNYKELSYVHIERQGVKVGRSDSYMNYINHLIGEKEERKLGL